MLKIRLQRIGRKNDPHYRVVVVEHTRGPKSGKFVERVGSRNPKTKETNLNAERIKYWLSVGAQASGTVHNMLVSTGIIKADKVNVLPKKTPIIKTEEVKEKKETAKETEGNHNEKDVDASNDSDADAEKQDSAEEDTAEEDAKGSSKDKTKEEGSAEDDTKEEGSTEPKEKKEEK